VKKHVGIASKSQMTGPVEVPLLRTGSPFAKYRGIGHGGRPAGKKGILRRIRELRGGSWRALWLARMHKSAAIGCWFLIKDCMRRRFRGWCWLKA